VRVHTIPLGPLEKIGRGEAVEKILAFIPT
jgi:hypothetical protein